jgi:hypothetical protein
MYVWRKQGNGIGSKEEPVKEFDDGLDCIRYLVAYNDLQPSGVSYFKDIWH